MGSTPQFHPDHPQRRALAVCFDMLQTTLLYKEILIEMDLSLYLPALEHWCQKYPNMPVP